MTGTKKHSTRRYRSPSMRVGKFVARWVFLKPALKTQLTVRVHGRGNLSAVNRKQAFIIASNHASHLDSLLIMSKLPWRLARKASTASAADFWFKSRLRSLPVRILMITSPVDRSGTNRYKGLSSDLLNQDVPLIIMPEGKRTRTGAINEFKPGAAALAIKHEIPIVPVAIVGSFEAWPPDNKVWRRGRPPVYINFGKPLSPKPGESVEKFNKRLRSTILKLYGERKKLDKNN
jgi:1-acyl-sn-glycerol-3-phosphate acyltransferase